MIEVWVHTTFNRIYLDSRVHNLAATSDVVVSLTFQVLDLLDVVGEAAAGQDEEELDEGDDEGDEGADEEEGEHVAEEYSPDGQHAPLSVDHVLHRGDRGCRLERRLKRETDLNSVSSTRVGLLS